MVKDGDTVKVHYNGTLADGTVFDTSEGREPLEFTLGKGRVIPGFEKAVSELELGESKTVTIPSAEAYGPHYMELVMVVKKEQLPTGLGTKVGEKLQGKRADGNTIIATVTDISEETVTLDANHPLAGKDLTFEIELVGIN